MEGFEILSAYSRGIIEVGSITLVSNGIECNIDIEEVYINHNYEFKAFVLWPEDRKALNINIDGESGKILDEDFLSYLQSEYQALSPQR
jgi:hypothetical protein